MKEMKVDQSKMNENRILFIVNDALFLPSSFFFFFFEFFYIGSIKKGDLCYDDGDTHIFNLFNFEFGDNDLRDVSTVMLFGEIGIDIGYDDLHNRTLHNMDDHRSETSICSQNSKHVDMVFNILPSGEIQGSNHNHSKTH